MNGGQTPIDLELAVISNRRRDSTSSRDRLTRRTALTLISASRLTGRQLASHLVHFAAPPFATVISFQADRSRSSYQCNPLPLACAPIAPSIVSHPLEPLQAPRSWPLTMSALTSPMLSACVSFSILHGLCLVSIWCGRRHMRSNKVTLHFRSSIAASQSHHWPRHRSPRHANLAC